MMKNAQISSFLAGALLIILAAVTTGSWSSFNVVTGVNLEGHSYNVGDTTIVFNPNPIWISFASAANGTLDIYTSAAANDTMTTVIQHGAGSIEIPPLSNGIDSLRVRSIAGFWSLLVSR